MFEIKSESLPKLVVNDLAYLAYYSLYWYILSFFVIVPLFQNSKFLEIKTDYVLFLYSWIFWVVIGVFLKFLITPIEKKIIKRNIFVAGLIKVLKKHRSITFRKIVEEYSYIIFQNRKVTSWDFEWASYIEALIALDVIELKNHGELKEDGKDLDFKIFSKKLFKAELTLKDRRINVDELIKRLDNYVL